MAQTREKVVVTGGAGFIGSHLVDRLISEAQSDIVVLDNLQRGRLANIAQHAESPRLNFVEGDIRDERLVDKVIRGATTVYHLAAQSSVTGALEDLEYSFSTNVDGTFNVLRAAARESVESFVFASSREVYGEPIELPVDEAHPLQSVNFYGASKVVGEAYCRAFRRAYGLNTVVLRVANAYGQRDIGRVIPRWVERAANGESLTVFGGNQVLDFIWVGHVIEALLRTAQLRGPTPPINIGSGRGTRIIDLARRIQLEGSGECVIQIVPARAVEVVQFVARVDRMRQLLDLAPPEDPLEKLSEVCPRRLALA